MKKKSSLLITQDPSLKKCLWAPWRIHYIQNAAKPARCFLCAMLKAPPARDRENLLLLRGKTCFVCLNRFPYIGGHLLITPRRHVADLATLRPAEHTEMMQLATKMVGVLRRVMKPQGFN